MSLSADHYEAGPLPAHSSVPVHDQLLIREDSICILTSYLRHVTCVVLCEICSILLLTTDHCARNWHGHVWGRSRGQLGSEVVKLWTKILMSSFGLAPLCLHNLLLMHVPFEKMRRSEINCQQKSLPFKKFKMLSPKCCLWYLSSKLCYKWLHYWMGTIHVYILIVYHIFILIYINNNEKEWCGEDKYRETEP